MKAIMHTALAILAAAQMVTAALAAGPRYRLEVAGLACPICAYGVEREVKSLGAVERIETRVSDGIVVVTMKEGATLDEAAARKAIERAGFTLKGFEQMPMQQAE